MKKIKRKRTKSRLKKGDTVYIISGKEKGNSGRIISINWKKENLLVEGLNMVIRNTKPNQRNQQGGMIKIESPIHYSNVQLFNPNLKKGVRFRNQINQTGVKTRVCVKTGEAI